MTLSYGHVGTPLTTLLCLPFAGRPCRHGTSRTNLPAQDRVYKGVVRRTVGVVDVRVAFAGVNVYVVDSGIDKTHPEFGGRVKLFGNFVAGEDENDYNGHGNERNGCDL